ncbi:MAG: MotE family protein [Planctomycetota bacterium]|jgi:flagellar motility protein MotE (MotC chaperone)
MKKFLKAAGLVILSFCALNFFILGGLVLYVVNKFDVNKEKVQNARLALEGRRYMNEDEEMFLARFKDQEIKDVLATLQHAQMELQRGEEELNRRKVLLEQSNRYLALVSEEIKRERYETGKVLAKVESERKAVEQSKKKTIEDIQSASFKKKYETVMRMEPENAAIFFETVTPEEAAKYAAMMSTRKSAAIFNALMLRPGGPELVAKIVAGIKDIRDMQNSGT